MHFVLDIHVEGITWDFNDNMNSINFSVITFTVYFKQISEYIYDEIFQITLLIKLFFDYFHFRAVGNPAFTASVISPGASYSW